MIPVYFKVTNKNENHYGFQYHEGLNILTTEFNSDPDASCVPGGLYFTNGEFIHEFYSIGCDLRIVELPTDDKDFMVVKDPDGNKWRANRIILKGKYPLDRVDTYVKFGIKLPSIHLCAERGYMDLLQYLLENGEDIHGNNDRALRWASSVGRLDVVKFLFDNGADIHAVGDGAVKLASLNGHLAVVKYLVENGANIHDNNEYALRYSLYGDHVDVFKYLLEMGADLNIFNQEKHLLHTAKKCNQYLKEIKN